MFQEDLKPFAYEIYLDPENNYKNRIIRTKSNTLFKLIRALKIPYIALATLAVILLVGSVLLISFGTAGYFKARPVSSYWSSNIAVNISNCGISSVQQSINGSLLNKIINGQVAVANSWPFIVSLRIGGSHICAGTIIDSNYILTARHCLIGLNPSDLTVIVGSSSLSDSTEQHSIEKFIFEPNGRDLALIKLNMFIRESQKTSAICLPTSTNDQLVFDKELVTIGWGSTNGINSQAALSQNLLQTTLGVLNRQPECSSYDTSLDYCCKDTNKSRNSITCFGDSGGPLMYFTNNRWFVYGISSYGLTSNCDTSYPSFFAKVPLYLEWIETIITSSNKKLADTRKSYFDYRIAYSNRLVFF